MSMKYYMQADFFLSIGRVTQWAPFKKKLWLSYPFDVLSTKVNRLWAVLETTGHHNHSKVCASKFCSLKIDNLQQNLRLFIHYTTLRPRSLLPRSYTRFSLHDLGV